MIDEAKFQMLIQTSLMSQSVRKQHSAGEVTDNVQVDDVIQNVESSRTCKFRLIQCKRLFVYHEKYANIHLYNYNYLSPSHLIQ